MSLNKSESSSSINTLDLLPSADPGPSQEDEPKDAALIDAQSRVQREVALRHADWAISKLSTANMRTCYDNDIDHYTKEMRLLGLLCRRLQVPLTDSTMNAFYRNGLPTELHELAIRIWSVSGNENLTINDVVPWIKQMSEVSDGDEMEDVGSPEIFAPSASGSDDLGITQPISTLLPGTQPGNNEDIRGDDLGLDGGNDDGNGRGDGNDDGGNGGGDQVMVLRPGPTTQAQ